MTLEFIIKNHAARNARKYYQKGSAPDGLQPDATPKGPANKVVTPKAKPAPKRVPKKNRKPKK